MKKKQMEKGNKKIELPLIKKQFFKRNDKEEVISLSFWKLGLFWVGVLCFCLGSIFLITDLWPYIPDWIKVSVGGVLLVGIFGITIYFFKKERRFLAEIGLFVGFLGIGAFIGLIAQVFNLPLDSGKGLFLWAILSFGIVLFSQKIYLSVLWIPMFFGGILGYLKWEFLFLFFQQVPVLTTFLISLILLMIIYISSDFKSAFAIAVRHWAIILFYGIIILGDLSIHAPVLGAFLSIILLLALNVIAVIRKREFLFNITSFLIILRIIILYFQLVPQTGIRGIGLILLGGFLLGYLGVTYLRKK